MPWLWISLGILGGIVLGFYFAKLQSKNGQSANLGNSVTQTLQELREKIEQSQQNVSLNQEIKILSNLYERLNTSTTQLMRALRTPTVCGRWGEIQLRQVIELVGMQEHCDFEEQVSIQTENGRLRPDLVIHLPGGKNIIVDAKAPIQSYLTAMEMEEGEEQSHKLRDHVRQIRSHISMLSSKSYWELFANTPEFVVLFLPGECFFSSAVREDQELIQDAIRQKVILASPTTLIAILQSIHYAWRQEKITKNAQEIGHLSQELYDRVFSFVETFQKMGVGLSKAVDSFNSALGSLETKVLPSIQKLKNLEMTNSKELPEIHPITAIPRLMPSKESKQNAFAFSGENTEKNNMEG